MVALLSDLSHYALSSHLLCSYCLRSRDNREDYYIAYIPVNYNEARAILSAYIMTENHITSFFKGTNRKK